MATVYGMFSGIFAGRTLRLLRLAGRSSWGVARLDPVHA
jgi:hypothetical protein